MNEGGVGARLHGLSPGPELVAVLNGLGPVRRRMVDAAGVREVIPDASDQVLVARAWQQVISWAESRLNGAVLQVAGGRSGPDDEDWGREEVAAGLRWSNQAAAERLEVARALRGRCVLTGAVLESGQITYRHAVELVRALEPLDDEAAAEVEARLLDAAEKLTPVQLGRRARKAVMKADPAGADARHRKARAKRRVDFVPLPDAMAEVRLVVTAEAGARIRAILNQAAGRGRVGDDKRTIDQRRADALVALTEVGWMAARTAAAGSPALGDASPAGARPGSAGPAGAGPAGARPEAASPEAVGLRATRSGATRSRATGAGGTGAGGAGAGGAGAGGAGTGGAGAGGLRAVGTGTGARTGTGTGAVGSRAVDAEGTGAMGSGGAGLEGERMAELVRAVLAGKRAAPPRVALTAPLSTVLGATDLPGELTGYGPVPPCVVRELAADGRWEKWSTDVGGVVTDLGRSTYRPPAALADLIRAAYPTCMFPGCSMPSYRCDLDHNIRRIDGGPTSMANMVPACRRHHRAKDEGGWDLVHDPITGSCTWTSPAGHTYTVDPPDQSDGEPECATGWDTDGPNATGRSAKGRGDAHRDAADRTGDANRTGDADRGRAPAPERVPERVLEPMLIGVAASGGEDLPPF